VIVDWLSKQNFVELVVSYAMAHALVTGCSTSATLGRAEVMHEGQIQFGGTFELQLGTAKVASDIEIPLPAYVTGATGRIGLANGFEAGARLTGGWFPSFDALQIGADFKGQIYSDNSWHIAAQLSETWERFSLQGSPIYGLTTGIGFPLGRSIGPNEITLVPKIHYSYVFGEGFYPLGVTWYGSSLAYHWKINDSVECVPDVSMMVSDVGFNGTRPEKERSGASVIQLSLSVNYFFPQTATQEKPTPAP
jgi:hypothetical protein